jgi:hypothetical protein
MQTDSLLKAFCVSRPKSNLALLPCLRNWENYQISKIEKKKTFGYDEISTKLLKISSPLNCICNKSLSKVFENAVHIRPLEHLNNNISVEVQFGFMVKLTTEKATHD